MECEWTGQGANNGADYWWDAKNWRDGHIAFLGDTVVATDADVVEPALPVEIAWTDTLMVTSDNWTLLGPMKSAPEWAKRRWRDEPDKVAAGMAWQKRYLDEVM